MGDPWKLLEENGLPDGAIRPVGHARSAAAELRLALAEAMRSVEPERREPLLAWLSAFEHHWPRRFGEELGEEGRAALSRLARAPVDANRYLKLRRIAIENLAALRTDG